MCILLRYFESKSSSPLFLISVEGLGGIGTDGARSFAVGVSLPFFPTTQRKFIGDESLSVGHFYTTTYPGLLCYYAHWKFLHSSSYHLHCLSSDQSQSPILPKLKQLLRKRYIMPTSVIAFFSATSLHRLLSTMYLIILAVRDGESGSPELVALRTWSHTCGENKLITPCMQF